MTRKVRGLEASGEAPSPVNRAALRLHVGLALPLTVAAVVLNSVSIDQVRLLLPTYPRFWVLGVYTPLAPVRFFHALGNLGLAVAFVFFVALTFMTSRTTGSPMARLASLGVVVHVAGLLLAILAYGWCLWRLAGVLQQMT